MKRVWNNWLKDAAFIYCCLYTFVTILNSILYLAQGIYEDSSGNMHEINRAIIIFIIVLAYFLIVHLKIKNYGLRASITYVITIALVYLYVYFYGYFEKLAPSAYKDISINFTMGFMVIAIIAYFNENRKKPKAVKS